MVVVIPHLELASDQIGDPTCRPRRIREPVVHSTLPEEGAQLLVLGGRESRDSTTSNGGLKATVAPQSCFPGVDRMHGDTEVIRNLLVPVGSALNPFESGQAALLELSARVVGRLPTRHTASLSTQIFAVINRRQSV